MRVAHHVNDLPKALFGHVVGGGLGIATVYRTLNHLVEAGELTPVELPGEAPRYERAGAAHHHHFQCRDCRKVYCVYGCPGIQELTPPGFAVETHEIAMQGVCRDCRKTGNGPTGSTH
jgi:Fur family ferric uptake transcriptional regulator